MEAVGAFYRSTIGKKVVMAVTGLILTSFVFFHMIGNLKIYFGTDEHGVYYLDHYAEWLKYELGAPVLMPTWGLWLARLVLLAAITLHVLSAFQLWLRARAARSTSYKSANMSPAFIAMMMRLGGTVIGLFIIYHLFHFTITVNNQLLFPGFEAGEVYHNVIVAFNFLPASLIYIVAMIALGLHIFHGGWSMFQTVGLNSKRWKMTLRTVAAVVAALVMIGNISFPLAVLMGVVHL